MLGRYLRLRLIDVSIGVGIVLLDQAIKCLSLKFFSIGEYRFLGSCGPVDLSFTLATNQGAAWGICEEFPNILLAFRFFFILLLSGVYAASKSASIRIALATILAGACSNIIDTLYRGQVIDMIHFRFWEWDYPIFNVADIAICVGAVYIVVYNIFFEKTQGER
jgi:signal peptidase II